MIEGLDYGPTRLLGNWLPLRFWIEISHFSENKEQKVLKVTNFEICGYFIARSSKIRRDWKLQDILLQGTKQ